jgi:hypothetical protein
LIDDVPVASYLILIIQLSVKSYLKHQNFVIFLLFIQF